MYFGLPVFDILQRILLLLVCTQKFAEKSYTGHLLGSVLEWPASLKVTGVKDMYSLIPSLNLTE
jgi:hypothetical protein